MTPEAKEIAFWLSVGERPPFVDECKIEWDDWFSDARYSLRFILCNFLVNIYSSEVVPW